MGQERITVTTLGQSLLLASGHVPTRLAAALGVSRHAVEKWRAGESTPTPEMRALIEAALEIPASAWTVHPMAKTPARSFGTKGRQIVLAAAAERRIAQALDASIDAIEALNAIDNSQKQEA